MSVRDEEIKRLVSYAKGFGTKVAFLNRPLSVNGVASWSSDGSEIEVAKAAHRSKTQIILSLIHEIAHGAYFAREQNRQIDSGFESALENEGAGTATDKDRLKIYEFEKASTEHWDQIVADCNIGIPKWKVELAKVIDVWSYEFNCDTGAFPTKRQYQAKKLELIKRFKPRKRRK
jgi:hypothetical protein